MNAYKAKMVTRMNLVSFAAAIAALVFLALTIFRDQLPVLPSFIKGFHIGAFIGFEVIAVSYLGKCMKARRDDTEMKKMYIEENDERTGLILRNASTLGMSVILMGLGVAAIVSGFFSATIFFTLMACLLFVLVVFFGLWAYYAKKL